MSETGTNRIPRTTPPGPPDEEPVNTTVSEERIIPVLCRWGQMVIAIFTLTVPAARCRMAAGTWGSE